MDRIGTVGLPENWPARPQAPKIAVVNRLPDGYSDDFNPDRCPKCYGVGLLSHEGGLRECPHCRPSEALRLGRLAAMLDDCRANLVRQFGEHPPGFDDFDLLDSDHKRMVGAALAFVDRPLAWLTIHGKGTGRRGGGSGTLGGGEWRTGAGKTHLGVAIARRLIDFNVPAYYTRTGELMRWLGGVERTENDPDYAARLKWIKALPVLILDDFNQEHTSNFVWQTRSEILISRYESWRHGGPHGATVILSNDQPSAWDDPSIASRVHEAGTIILASSYDYRLTLQGEGKHGTV